MSIIDTITHSHLSLITIVTAVCFISGFIPTIGTEIYLALLAIKLQDNQLIPVAIAASVGLMLAKGIIYTMGFGAVKILPQSQKDKMHALQQKYGKASLGKKSLVFSSALVGLPPLYIVNILCGILKVNFTMFTLMGFLGTFIRFVLVVFLNPSPMQMMP